MHSTTAITIGGIKNAIKRPATNPSIQNINILLPILFKNILIPPPRFLHRTVFSVLSIIVLYARVQISVTYIYKFISEEFSTRFLVTKTL